MSVFVKNKKEKIMLIPNNFHITKATKKRLKRELEEAQKLNNVRLHKITWSLLLLGENRGVAEVSRLLHVSCRTIYEWFSLFLVKGFRWLKGLHFQGRGRKPKLIQEQKEKLYDIIVQGPEKAGYDCGGWNSAMIKEVIQKEFNVIFNPRYVCTILKNMKLSYQKAKFISDRIDDPDNIKARRRWKCVTWPKILREAKLFDGVILFGDEVSFAQWGSLARTWAPRGVQPEIKTSGKRKGLKIFGAIEFHNGGFVYQECTDKFTGDTYISFLKHILNKYSKPVFLIEDGAPYHKSKIVKTFTDKMKDAGRLFVHRLPSYSPDLNPIEKLWKQTKKDATHLKYFPLFDDLRAAVLKAFQKYLNDAMQIFCVMRSLRKKARLV